MKKAENKQERKTSTSQRHSVFSHVAKRMADLLDMMAIFRFNYSCAQSTNCSLFLAGRLIQSLVTPATSRKNYFQSFLFASSNDHPSTFFANLSYSRRMRERRIAGTGEMAYISPLDTLLLKRFH